MQNFKEAVVQVDGIFDKRLIKKLVGYADKADLDYMQIASGKDTSIRHVKGTHLSQGKNMTEWVFYRVIEQELMRKFMPNICPRLPHFNPTTVNQIDLLKYEAGGHYQTHCDEDSQIMRKLTCIINLNEDYEGGDFVIKTPNDKEELGRYKLKTGSVLMFPSNFLYPHLVEPITSGVRYSCVAWIQ